LKNYCSSCTTADVGARLGKSGGALVQQVLVLALGSIMRGAPLVAGLFYVVVLMWIGECC
jgi:AAA family ATP:ADP antiporter